jgi:hypothetical protein
VLQDEQVQFSTHEGVQVCNVAGFPVVTPQLFESVQVLVCCPLCEQALQAVQFQFGVQVQDCDVAQFVKVQLLTCIPGFPLQVLQDEQ